MSGVENPGTRRGHVHRGRLADRVDRAGPGDVVLVSAPAGYGKTALLADWASTDPVHTAWLSLSPAENGGRGFWSGLLGSLRSCPAVPADSPLHDLALSAGAAPGPELVAAVADGLFELDEPLTVILDNTQELTAQEAVRGLRSLLSDRPAGLRLVLSGRRDPPVQLARLRAADRLVEVRAEHLRFTAAEAGEMLAAAGYAYDAELVAQLVAATAGWAAGLRLAAPALATGTAGFVDDLVATDRAMSDYLVEEVLQTVSEPDRQVLTAVSIREDVSASLAAALSELPQAGDVLDSLERETGLVYRTGPGRSRYVIEPLFRAHLLADLRRRHPDAEASLHVRAARWLAEQDRAAEAVDHALRSGSADLLAALVRRHGLLLLAAGEHARIRLVAARLRGTAAGDALVALLGALAHLEVGELAAADRLAATAAERWPDDPAEELTVLRRVVAARREYLTSEHVTDTPQDAVDVARLGLAPIAVVDRAFSALLAQRVDAARELAGAALERAGANGYLAARCLTVLAAIAAVDGSYAAMAALAERAEARAPVEQWAGTSTAAVTLCLRAYRALLLARPAECLERGDAALAQADAPGQALPVVLDPLLAAMRGAAMTENSEVTRGLALLASARAASGSPGHPIYRALLAVLEHRAAIDLGYVGRAREVVDWAAEHLPGSAEVEFLQACQQFHAGRDAPAGHHLDVVLRERGAPPVIAWVVVDAWALSARVALRSGNRGQALRAVRQAVQVASTLDVLRPLTQADDVVELIKEASWPAATRPFTARVLAASRSRAPQPRAALTESERSVLGMLSTQRSIGEIARALTVSPNTVKTHVRTIYGKLGVHTRRDALAAARAGGLLSD